MKRGHLRRGQIKRTGKDRYQIKVFLGRDKDGKRRYHTETVHGKAKEAESVLEARHREKDRGSFIGQSRMTLGEFLEIWLEEKVKTKVRFHTYESYRWICRRYLGELSVMQLSKIQPYTVQRFINELNEEGLSPRTVRLAYTVLSAALRQCVEWNQLGVSPCRGISLPKKAKKEMKYLSPEGVKRFAASARESKHFALFLLAVETGLRPSEYLALRWQDVDFDSLRVTVHRRVRSIKGGYNFEEPKTGKKRSVPISTGLAAELRAHKRRQAEEKMRNRTTYADLDLVFACGNGAPLRSENIRNRHFYPLLEKAGLERVRLYDLRHTTATLLMYAGEHPKVVQERLGHASITLTMDTYTHLGPDMQKGATSKLERMILGG